MVLLQRIQPWRLGGLLLLSVLLAPWIHDYLKPYRLRFEVSLHHATPTAVTVYHSTDRKHPEVVQPLDFDNLFIVYAEGLPPPLALLHSFIASTRPITGFRFDPSQMPNQIALGSIQIDSLTASATLTAEQLEPLARAGQQIEDVQLQNGLLRFRTTGNDAHFSLPLPAEIAVPSMAQRGFWYLVAWLMAVVFLLFVRALVDRARAEPAAAHREGAQQPGRQRFAAWFPKLALDLMALGLLTSVMIDFLAMNTRLDLTPLKDALSRDGIGEAVPLSVREMKRIAQRQRLTEVHLYGSLGDGEDENMVFQRATEYLYPVRVVPRSRWVFSVRSINVDLEGARCQPVDEEGGVVLHECNEKN